MRDRKRLTPGCQRRSTCGLEIEREAWRKGYALVAGVDEVGRGALAGPVMATAIILNPSRIPEGIDDSKRLTEIQRERLAESIRITALAYATEMMDAQEIDRLNILRATKATMMNAVAKLDPQPDFVLIDALTLEHLQTPQRAVIRGDQLSQSIAAASIIAKVTRDHFMQELHSSFPEYGWNRNVGYGTRTHLDVLSRLGPTPYHRLSFRGVRTTVLSLWQGE